MSAIFYDLETTDKCPIGQILNYSFIQVDQNFAPTDELSGQIKISCLELPSPEAILANKVDVIEHQKLAVDTEQQAMKKIWDFFQRKEKSKPTPRLIGFNSSRFDLNFLRTSLIRNGLNPYFKLEHADLLHFAKKLSIHSDEFPRPVSKQDSTLLSLSLENLSQALGLLKAEQKHESREDVLLSIELAKVFFKRFKLNIFRELSYEAGAINLNNERGNVFELKEPNYEIGASGRYVCASVVLLDENHRYSLWIDLKRYMAGEKEQSIFLKKKQTGYLFLRRGTDVDAQTLQLAEQAMREYAHINLSNYFAAQDNTDIDIEQDIYRLDFSCIEALNLAIWNGKADLIKKMENKDLKVIYSRFQLRNYLPTENDDPRLNEMLRQYAQYRYNGRALLYRANKGESRTHATLAERMSQIESLLQEVKPEAKVYLISLQKFYRDSKIFEMLTH